jgi:hypothetical protein
MSSEILNIKVLLAHIGSCIIVLIFLMKYFDFQESKRGTLTEKYHSYYVRRTVTLKMLLLKQAEAHYDFCILRCTSSSPVGLARLTTGAGADAGI